MAFSQFRSILPYLVGLLLAAAMFVYIDRLDYTHRPGQLGPDTWPKLAILLMAAASSFEIVRRLVRGAALTRGVIDLLVHEDDGGEAGIARPWMLAGGIALVAAYAVLVTTLGFVLDTFLFFVAFMYLGGYRNHAAIWAISAGVTVLIGVLFLRVAYISLPRGEPPFDRVTDFVRLVLG
jgi:hypothetical protein